MNKRRISLLVLIVALVAMAVPVFSQHKEGRREKAAKPEKEPMSYEEKAHRDVLTAAEKANAEKESQKMKANPVEKAFRGPDEDAETKAGKNLETGRDVQKDNDRVQQEKENGPSVDPLGGRSSVTEKPEKTEKPDRSKPKN